MQVNQQLGIDWFAFDDNGPHPDLVAAIKNVPELAYAYVRAAFSTSVDDFDPNTPGIQDAAQQLDAIEAAGLVAGSYLMPDYRKGAAPAVAQMRTFGEHCGLRPGRLPYIIDLELGGRGLAGLGYDSPTQARRGVASFLVELLDAAEKEFPGACPIMYCSQRVTDTDDADTLAHAADAALARCDFALARYPYRARIDFQHYSADTLPSPPVPKAAGDADNWLDHQWQGDALHVLHGAVDANRWHALTSRSPDGVRKRRAKVCLRTALGDRYVGDFDADVRAFQRDHRLVADGIVGVRCWAWLGWYWPTNKPHDEIPS